MSLMEIRYYCNSSPPFFFKGHIAQDLNEKQCLKNLADIKTTRYWNTYWFKCWYCLWDKEVKLLWLIVLQFFLYLLLDPTPIWGKSPTTHIGGHLMWYPIHFFWWNLITGSWSIIFYTSWNPILYTKVFMKYNFLNFICKYILTCLPISPMDKKYCWARWLLCKTVTCLLSLALLALHMAKTLIAHFLIGIFS